MRGSGGFSSSSSAPTDIIVGQKVTLTIECDEGTISNVGWSIPAVAVKNYRVWENDPDADCDSGYCAKIYYLEEDDLNQPTVSFYWVTGGSKEVSVSFTASLQFEQGGFDSR